MRSDAIIDSFKSYKLFLIRALLRTFVSTSLLLSSLPMPWESEILVSFVIILSFSKDIHHFRKLFHVAIQCEAPVSRRSLSLFLADILAAVSRLGEGLLGPLWRAEPVVLTVPLMLRNIWQGAREIKAAPKVIRCKHWCLLMVAIRTRHQCLHLFAPASCGSCLVFPKARNHATISTTIKTT